MNIYKFDLGEYHERFDDALESKYQSKFTDGFADIERSYKAIREGSRDLSIDDVMAIFSTALPYERDWTLPDRENLSSRMEILKVSQEIRLLSDSHNEQAFTRIWKCFRELSLTSLILHHVYPNRYAMCSHHLASLLHISGPTIPKFYENYCSELVTWGNREWKKRRKLSAADAEFALWTWYRLAHHGDPQEQKQHRRAFNENEWVHQRRAKQIALSLGSPGKLDLARHYLDVDPTVSAMIAWRELEIEIRKLLEPENGHNSVREYPSFREMLDRLDGDIVRTLTKGDLKRMWKRRSTVVHGEEEITVDKRTRRNEAETLLDDVRRFIEYSRS